VVTLNATGITASQSTTVATVTRLLLEVCVSV
jgi:hypothetical protein